MTAKLLSVNSDSETCEVCGKTGLKRVMWIETEEKGIMAYGVCCGKKALGITNNKVKTVEQVVEIIAMREKLNLVISSATEESKKFNERIAVIRYGNTYYTVREKAYNSNPQRYGFPVQWVE